jgi:hypothetical protein
MAGPPSLTTRALAPPSASCMAPPVGCPARTSCGTLSLRPRSKRAGCAPHEQCPWGGPRPRRQAPSPQNEGPPAEPLLETGRRGRLPNRRRGLPRWRLRHPLWPPQRGQGIRLSYPAPVARVPTAALPVEGRRSACRAAGSTRRPRTRARARSGRHNTSPGWCPPARSQRTPLTGSAIRLRLPSVGRRTHPQPPGRDRAQQRRPRASHRGSWDGTSCSSRGGGAQPRMGSFRVTDAAAPAATGLAAAPAHW